MNNDLFSLSQMSKFKDPFSKGGAEKQNNALSYCERAFLRKKEEARGIGN